jgi:hypothetical protein
MAKTELETHQAALDKFIEEYKHDPCSFWLVNMREAINSVLYLQKQEHKPVTA